MDPEKYLISPPLNALLVDDDEIALLTFSAALRHHGFHNDRLLATISNLIGLRRRD